MEILNDIQTILRQARQKAYHNINIAMVSAYWLIGKHIVEDDQQGQNRAVYGKALMQKLSKTLQSEFGKGFSVDNLENMRRFYISYSAVELGSENKAALESLISETVSRKSQAPEFNLSWSHYLMLTSICRFHFKNK